MKFIKNGIIFEPKNEFVIKQMSKAGSGYLPYDDTKEEIKEETKEEVKEVAKEEVKEATKDKKKKK